MSSQTEITQRTSTKTLTGTQADDAVNKVGRTTDDADDTTCKHDDNKNSTNTGGPSDKSNAGIAPVEDKSGGNRRNNSTEASAAGTEKNSEDVPVGEADMMTPDADTNDTTETSRQGLNTFQSFLTCVAFALLTGVLALAAVHLTFAYVLNESSDEPSLDCSKDGRNFSDRTTEDLPSDLKGLNLARTGITDRSILSLHRQTKLTRLDLSYTRITNEGIRTLSVYDQLTSLRLDGTSITDPAIASIRLLTKLKHLSLDLTPNLGNLFIEQLVPAPALEELSLKWTNTDNNTALSFRELKGLRVLNLEATKITDFGLLFLPLDLQELNLDRTDITDKCVSSLLGLKKLRRLSLSDTKITAVGRDKLRRAFGSSLHIGS